MRKQNNKNNKIIVRVAYLPCECSKIALTSVFINESAWQYAVVHIYQLPFQFLLVCWSQHEIILYRFFICLQWEQRKSTNTITLQNMQWTGYSQLIVLLHDVEHKTNCINNKCSTVKSIISKHTNWNPFLISWISLEHLHSTSKHTEWKRKNEIQQKNHFETFTANSFINLLSVGNSMKHIVWFKNKWQKSLIKCSPLSKFLLRPIKTID